MKVNTLFLFILVLILILGCTECLKSNDTYSMESVISILNNDSKKSLTYPNFVQKESIFKDEEKSK